MKKTIIILLVFLVTILASCDTTVSLPSTPKLISREEIVATAVVQDYNEDHWYGGYQHHYKFSAKVYCKEYNITKTLVDEQSGMWITSKIKGLKKGDTVDVVVVKTTYDTHTITEIVRIK